MMEICRRDFLKFSALTLFTLACYRAGVKETKVEEQVPFSRLEGYPKETGLEQTLLILPNGEKDPSVGSFSLFLKNRALIELPVILGSAFKASTFRVETVVSSVTDPMKIETKIGKPEDPRPKSDKVFLIPKSQVDLEDFNLVVTSWENWQIKEATWNQTTLNEEENEELT